MPKPLDRTQKGTIAVIIVILLIGVAVYGSYMPMRKSQTYISTLQSFSATPPTSLNDLESRLSPGLNYPSPIGQEELVRNTANSVLGLLQQGLDASTTAALVNFLDSYYDPILTRGVGMSFGQDVYLEGAVNELAFANTGDPVYLNQSLKYFSLGHELGPNRPQALYGLYSVYRAMGDVTNTEMTANQILANWPSDSSTMKSLGEFLMTASGTPASAHK